MKLENFRRSHGLPGRSCFHPIGGTLHLLVLATWFITSSLSLSLSASGPGIDIGEDDNSLILSWTSHSLTDSGPFLHYDYTLQVSEDLRIWQDYGGPIVGGVLTEKEIPRSAVIPMEFPHRFVRIHMRLVAPGADLAAVDLSDTDLRKADLTGADLSGANLSGSILEGASLKDADLSEAVLDRSWMLDADLDGATLNGASLNLVTGTPRLNRISAPESDKLWASLPDLPFTTRHEDYTPTHPRFPGVPIAVNCVILLLHPDSTVGQLNNLLERHGATLAGTIPASEDEGSHIVMLRLPTTTHTDLLAHITALEADPSVEVAVEDVMLSETVIPDDSGTISNWTWSLPAAEKNWNLEAMRAPQMWNLKDRIIVENDGALPSVVTGVYDTGFWWDHEDLDSGRTTWNILWPFLIADRLLGPDHGTHVSGIIAAVHENNKGIDGVNPFAQLSLFNYMWKPDFFNFSETTPKVLHQPGNSFATIIDDVESILETTELGVLNISMGYNWHLWLNNFCGISMDDIEKLVSSHAETIRDFNKKYHDKVLIVSAAGNDNGNIQECTSSNLIDIPAKYGNPFNYAGLVKLEKNIIVVGAHKGDLSPTYFSNSGPDVLAPGNDISSTIPHGALYDERDGSSQAAPHVSGLAGYLLAIDKDLKPLELYELIGMNQAVIDGFRSVMEIDNFRSGKKVLRMLLDIDDGSMDGNTRKDVESDSRDNNRSFEYVEEGAAINTNEDMDGDGGTGNGTIDMGDFRRWRDWYLFDQTLNSRTLNGDPDHIKHDANRNGRVNHGDETTLYPRGDFNGDGRMNLSATNTVPGVLASMGSISDINVFVHSGEWQDKYVDVSRLDELVDSVDLHVFANNFFTRNDDISEGVVSVYEPGSETPIDIVKPFRFNEENGEFIFTVPVGKTYLLRSEIIEAEDGARVTMGSIGDRTFELKDRGGDYAVDLVRNEKTVKARVNRANAGTPQSLSDRGSHSMRRQGVKTTTEEIIDSEPLEEEVDAFIPAGNDFVDDESESAGSRGWANEEATVYALSRTGNVEGTSGNEEGMLTFSSEVIWQKSFIKDSSLSDPTFEVEPIRLKVIDGTPDFLDLNARAEIMVEKRNGGSTEWETIFEALAEIGGYTEGLGGGHTFTVIDHQGDLPRQSLRILEMDFCFGAPDEQECLTIFFGAEYELGAYEGTIDLGDLEDGQSFDVRYTLKSSATSMPADEFAEGYIGDPLKYGSGMRMEYGNFGEKPRIDGCEPDAGGSRVVRFPAKEGFYYILERLYDDPEMPPLPVAMKIGTRGPDFLIDRSPGTVDSDCRNNYRIRNYPLDQPQDTDEDGIDDVYELGYPEFLDPLNPGDAGNDQDGDGKTNLAEYQDETDPEVRDAEGAEEARFPGVVVDIESGTYWKALDLNGDAIPDLAAFSGSDTGSMGIRTLLGNPDGTFQNAVFSGIPGLLMALDMATGDLDGDGSPDIALMDTVARRILVAGNPGNGRFVKSGEFAIAGTPTMVATGDINNDGVYEILTGSRNSELVIHSLSGENTWSPLHTIPLPSAPMAAVTGDFNGDGIVDAAMSLFNHQIAVLSGLEDGGYSEPQFQPSGVSPESLAVGDVNGDNAPDLVTANRSSNDVSVFINNGDGTMAPGIRYTSGERPSDLRLADVDGDGDLDIITAHPTTDFYGLLINPGDGQFSALQKVHATSNVPDVLYFDWNRDGLGDLAAPVVENSLLILPGRAEVGFESRFQHDIQNAILVDYEFGDLNGDARPELILLNQRENTIDVWELARLLDDGGKAVSLEASSEVSGVATGDFNGDGSPDIVVSTREPQFFGEGENSIQFFYGGSGDFEFSEPEKLTPGFAPDLILPGDFNGDGTTDLLVISLTQSRMQTWMAEGNGSFSADADFSPGQSIATVMVADLNNNGEDEIVAAVRNSQEPRSLLQSWTRSPQQNGSWEAGQSIVLTSDIPAMCLVDFTGDGNPEILATISSRTGQPGPVRYFPIDSDSGEIGNHVDLVIPSSRFSSISAADLNGDGLLDLVFPDGYLEQLPDGSFSSLNRYWVDYANDIRVLDVNADGRPDITGMKPGAMVILLQEE